jgi:hypothetical protein
MPGIDTINTPPPTSSLPPVPTVPTGGKNIAMARQIHDEEEQQLQQQQQQLPPVKSGNKRKRIEVSPRQVGRPNIGAFCLRMRENCSVRLQMVDLLGGCEFCHGFYEKYGLNFCSISPNSC